MFKKGFDKIATGISKKRIDAIKSGLAKRMASPKAIQESKGLTSAEKVIADSMNKGVLRGVAEHLKTAPKKEAKGLLKALRWTQKYK